mmetsp:Transcript_18444/g.45873  ORF Transcript_18444/g.45873 Transcript_18444/m.45873 type:complete len:444 (-) Transcript_18444:438-1769(-)
MSTTAKRPRTRSQGGIVPAPPAVGLESLPPELTRLVLFALFDGDAPRARSLASAAMTCRQLRDAAATCWPCLQNEALDCIEALDVEVDGAQLSAAGALYNNNRTHYTNYGIPDDYFASLREMFVARRVVGHTTQGLAFLNAVRLAAGRCCLDDRGDACDMAQWWHPTERKYRWMHVPITFDVGEDLAAIQDLQPFVEKDSQPIPDKDSQHLLRPVYVRLSADAMSPRAMHYLRDVQIRASEGHTEKAGDAKKFMFHIRVGLELTLHDPRFPGGEPAHLRRARAGKAMEEIGREGRRLAALDPPVDDEPSRCSGYMNDQRYMDIMRKDEGYQAHAWNDLYIPRPGVDEPTTAIEVRDRCAPVTFDGFGGVDLKDPYINVKIRLYDAGGSYDSYDDRVIQHRIGAVLRHLLIAHADSMDALDANKDTVCPTSAVYIPRPADPLGH